MKKTLATIITSSAVYLAGCITFAPSTKYNESPKVASEAKSLAQAVYNHPNITDLRLEIEGKRIRVMPDSVSPFGAKSGVITVTSTEGINTTRYIDEDNDGELDFYYESKMRGDVIPATQEHQNRYELVLKTINASIATRGK